MTARPDPKDMTAAAPVQPAPIQEIGPYYTRERGTVRQETLDALEQHYAYYTRD